MLSRVVSMVYASTTSSACFLVSFLLVYASPTSVERVLFSAVFAVLYIRHVAVCRAHFQYMQYVHDQYMFPALAPQRQHDRTYHEKKTGIESRHPGVVVAPAVNLQMAQDSDSLDGVITSIPWTAALGSLDLTSENIFNGISSAGVTARTVPCARWPKRPAHAQRAAAPVAQQRRPAPPDDMMPSEQQEDFWWSGVSCTLQCSDATRKAVGKDYDAGAVNFYQLYDSALPGDADADHAARDGCVWEPCVPTAWWVSLSKWAATTPAFSGVRELCAESGLRAHAGGQVGHHRRVHGGRLYRLEDLVSGKRHGGTGCGAAKAADLLQLKVFLEAMCSHPSQAQAAWSRPLGSCTRICMWTRSRQTRA